MKIEPDAQILLPEPHTPFSVKRPKNEKDILEEARCYNDREEASKSKRKKAVALIKTEEEDLNYL